MAHAERRGDVLKGCIGGGVVSAVFLLISGCGMLSPDRVGLGADARLVLHQSLRAAPDSVTVPVQGGLPVRSAYLLWYEPFCDFRLKASSADGQSIEPATFAITGVRRRQGSPALTLAATAAKLRIAGPLPLAMFENYTDYITEFGLRSPAQPNVVALVCHEIAESAGTFLSLAEIQQILGLVATVEGVSQRSR